MDVKNICQQSFSLEDVDMDGHLLTSAAGDDHIDIMQRVEEKPDIVHEFLMLCIEGSNEFTEGIIRKKRLCYPRLGRDSTRVLSVILNIHGRN